MENRTNEDSDVRNDPDVKRFIEAKNLQKDISTDKLFLELVRELGKTKR